MKVRLVFVGLCLLILRPDFLLGHPSKIDSLQRLLSYVSDSKKSDVLLQLHSEYIAVADYQKSIEVATMAVKLAETLNDTLKFIKSIRHKALSFRATNQLDSSLNLLLRVLPIAKKKNYIDEIKFILNGVGISLAHKASYDQALRYYFEILELPLGPTGVTERAVLVNIGLVFYKLKQYSTALDYFNRAWQLQKKRIT